MRATRGPQRMRLRLSKEGDARFVGHLDMMRLLERALRRARLPVAYSKGFNPHPRISLASALPLGVSSRAEYADVILDRPVRPGVFAERLNSVLPAGVRVLGCEEAPAGGPSLAAIMETSRYEAYGVVEHAGEGVPPSSSSVRLALNRAIQEILGEDYIPIHRERSDRSLNLRSLILDLELKWVGDVRQVEQWEPGGREGAARGEVGLEGVPGAGGETAGGGVWEAAFGMLLVTNQRNSARPDEVMAVLAGKLRDGLQETGGGGAVLLKEDALRFRRTACYFRTPSGLREILPLEEEDDG